MIVLVSSQAGLFAEGAAETPSTYAGEAGRITVYLSGPANMLERLEQMFEETHGDVLDFVQMGCGPLRQRVWTEYESGAIVADVFWGSDPLVYIALDEAGALDDFVPSGSEALKDVFKTEHNYTLVSERYGTIIYNSDALTGAAIPASYRALTASGLQNLITHADPDQSSTALALVAGLYELSGRNWGLQTALVENGLFLTRKNNEVPMKIQEGEYHAGIAPHDAVFRLRKKARQEGYPLPLATPWPEEGAIALQRPVAISRNPARPEVNQQIAEDFVEFLISRQAQQFMLGQGFVSVLADLPMPQGLPEEPNVYRVDWEALALKQDEIARDFSALFQ
jgi:iron(III) transport system substrate-binding protein